MSNRYKVILAGEIAVGKTSLAKRITRGEFDPYTVPTIGSTFSTYQQLKENIPIILEIWDTAGMEAFKSLVRMYYRNADVCIFVYDLSAVDFPGLKYWINDYKNSENNSDALVIMVGNKEDLSDRNVHNTLTYKAMQTYFKENNFKYFETSAFTGEGIKEMVDYIIDEVHEKEPIAKKRLKLVKKPDPKKGNCCT